MCPSGSGGQIAGIAIGAATGFILFDILVFSGLLGLLHHFEKKEKRALDIEEAKQRGIDAQRRNKPPVTKTIVVENRGPVAGIAGHAEIVTSGPGGSTTTTVPTIGAGVAIVSTEAAGVPGTVSVNLGKKVIVTAEHPPGKPEEAKVVQTVEKA